MRVRKLAAKRGALALLLLLATATAPGSTQWEAKSVHGYRIALAVEGIAALRRPGRTHSMRKRSRIACWYRTTNAPC